MELTQINQISHKDNYQYCYHKNNPYSLTITKKPKLIFNSLYKQGNYVWIIEDINQLQFQPSYIEQQSQVTINYVKKLSDLNQYEHKEGDIIIICNRSFMDEVEILLESMKKIKWIIFYGKGIKQLDDDRCINISYFDSQQKIFKEIKDNKKYNATGDFVNFISLDKQKWNSIIQVKTMLVMIQQSTNRKQLMQKFKQLSLLCHGEYEQDIQKIFQIYAKYGHLGGNLAVWWYTKETFLYRFINRILRISKDPTCIFIIQPYFQDLFNNIGRLYEEQRKKSDEKYKNFTCFRGAHISEKEIKHFKQNNELFIQNLGFLSTSRDEKKVNYFVGNALFVIHVDDTQRKSQLDYGFADLEGNSCNQYESQILFNPLNSFKVLNFQQIDELNLKYKYKITLKYGEIARVTASENEKLTQKEISLKWLGQHQIRQSKKCSVMGHILIENHYNLEGSEQYCDFFMEIIKDSQNQEAIADAHFLKGKVAQNKRDPKMVEIFYTKYLEINEERLSLGNKEKQKQIYIDIARCLYNLGVYFNMIDQNQKAVQYYLRCEKIQLSILGENHPDYARTLLNLGSNFYQFGQYQKAMSYFQRCQKIFRQEFGENHPDYIAILKKLATYFIRFGQYQNAFECHSRCQNFHRSVLGEEYPGYDNILSDLGSSFLNQCQFHMAIECYQKCQKIRRQKLGENHQDYALILNNLGQTFLPLGQYQKATEYFKKSSRILRKFYGKNHPKYAISVNNIGVSFYKKGQYQKAMVYYRRCQKIRRQTIGQSHILYANSLNNLGVISDLLNQNEEAEKYYYRSLNIIRSNFGEFHPEFANILRNLGPFFEKIGQNQKAIKCLERCFEIWTQSFREMDPEYAIALNILCHNCMKLRKYQKAVKYLELNEKIHRQVSKQNKLVYLDILSQLGLCFLNLGQYQKSKLYYEKCQQIQIQMSGQNHPNYAQTLLNLASCLINLHQYPRAAKYYDRGLNILKQFFNESDPKYAPVFYNLLILYSRMGQHEKFQICRKKLSQLQKMNIKKLNKLPQQKKQQQQAQTITSEQNQDKIIISYYLLDCKECVEEFSIKRQQKLAFQSQHFWFTCKFL